MLAAEIGVGLVGEDALQQRFLHLPRPMGGFLESRQVTLDRTPPATLPTNSAEERVRNHCSSGRDLVR